MSRSRERHLVFACFFVLYALTAPGDLTGDTEIRWAVANRVVDAGRVDLTPGTTTLYASGSDGRPYSFYGPGQSACLIPFVLAGRGLEAVLPGKLSSDLLGQFLASTLFFPACGALTVLLAYAITLDITGQQRAARWVAMALGVGTMHWHHTINTYEESQVAVCVLVAVWATQRGSSTQSLRLRVLALAAVGLAFSFRVSSVMTCAPFIFVVVIAELAQSPSSAARARSLSRWLLAAALGLAPFLILVGAYNALRFGSPFDTGYTRAHLGQVGGIRLFETPLLFGLSGMLVSPGKSVFLFCPVLLVALVGVPALWRVHRTMTAAVLAALTSTVLFHSKYTFWAGDLAWGPRFLASSMGLWVFGIIPAVSRPRFSRGFVTLLTLSIGVQLASIVYSFGLEFYQDRRHGTIPDGYVWRPAESQLVCRFRNIALHVLGRPDCSSIPPDQENRHTWQVSTTPESVRRMHAVNVFPFKARALTQSKPLSAALLAAWLTGVVLLASLVYRWHRFCISGDSQVGSSRTTGR